MKKLILPSLCLLLTSGCVAVVDVLKVDGAYGKVIDSQTKKPVVGATVYSNLKYASTQTNPTGTFLLNGVSKKRLTIILPADHLMSDSLTVEHPDYKKFEYTSREGFGSPYRIPISRNMGTIELDKKGPNQKLV
jgi:hypothetical protein